MGVKQMRKIKGMGQENIVGVKQMRKIKGMGQENIVGKTTDR